MLNIHCPFFSEPNHERALSNLAYFDDVRTNDPEKFIDTEMTPPPSGTDRLQPSEKEEYEALCREAKPLVSKISICMIWWVFSLICRQLKLILPTFQLDALIFLQIQNIVLPIYIEMCNLMFAFPWYYLSENLDHITALCCSVCIMCLVILSVSVRFSLTKLAVPLLDIV